MEDTPSYTKQSMLETVGIVVLVLLLVVIVLLSILLARGQKLSPIDHHLTSIKEGTEKLERTLREEVARNREEVRGSLLSFGEALRVQVADISRMQKDQLDFIGKQLNALTQSNEQRLEKMRETVEVQLRNLQEDNNRKLEQMRATVDEKLHATLEERLGQSFRIVSDRLEQVHKGLGEMQSLASGVGDLKKVLTNVKVRGTWGEIQLGTLLDQMLTPEQYSKNVVTKVGSNERVEYAIKLPGRSGGDGRAVWLPVDAKFPQGDYQRLIEAQEQANPVLADEAAKMLETRIKAEAKAIKEKYLDPPHTTDFAIMFLPVESLYAEVLRRPGLAESLQMEFRVTVAGPTTLAALLNSLQMGFRTLAIEKRSSEVWSLLGRVKTEFGRFGEVLDRTKKKLDEARNTIDTASTRSRAIERTLKDVQQLPASDTAQLFAPPNQDDDQ